MENLQKVFFETHNQLPREGPGDNESTRRAYSMLRDLPNNPRILDIGCGPGMQTVELAKLSNGRVFALDFFRQFLKQLQKSVEQEKVMQNINPVIGDMFRLCFEDSRFDLIWSEGAIYIIGFEKGLREWKHLLTAKGYIVASHIAWLRPNLPKEIQKYWENIYPEIKTIQENLLLARKLGFRVVDYFVLPERSWWENYYNPIEAKLP